MKVEILRERDECSLIEAQISEIQKHPMLGHNPKDFVTKKDLENISRSWAGQGELTRFQQSLQQQLDGYHREYISKVQRASAQLVSLERTAARP